MNQLLYLCLTFSHELVGRVLTVADWLTQVMKNGREMKQLIHTVLMLELIILT